jgi:hypothetical protein
MVKMNANKVARCGNNLQETFTAPLLDYLYRNMLTDETVDCRVSHLWVNIEELNDTVSDIKNNPHT